MKKQIIKHYKMHKFFGRVANIQATKKDAPHRPKFESSFFEKHNSLTASLRHTFLYVKGLFRIRCFA